jgi:hypothetical protein
MSSVRKFGLEGYVSFHVVGEEVWAGSSSEFFMRKFEVEADVSFHVVGEEIGREAHLSFHEEV